MDVSYVFARHIAKAKYEDLPAEAVSVTKLSILDILGVTVAASTLGQGCKEIVDLVKESGAKGKSTIVGYGGNVPSWMAGFANGSMSHQLDYDDAREDGRVHPSAGSVLAAFATAEEVGGINGKELITAVALSNDIVSRMGLASTLSGGARIADWHPSAVLGFYSATAAAGRVLGLTEDQLLNAFGHTLQQAAGSMQYIYSPGGVFRGIRDGFSIKGGILSALMAKRGLPGTKDSMESEAGLYNLYFKGAYDRSCLTDGLGKRFEGVNVSFKPWPSCRTTHGAIDATLGLVQERDIDPDSVEKINVSVAEAGRFVIEPIEQKRKPQTVIDAKVSTPFSLGVAIARRGVTLRDFAPDRLTDPLVLRLAQKVEGKPSPELKKQHSAIVEIATRDGKQYTKRVDMPYGHPSRPLPKKDLVKKFRDCVSYSAKPVCGEKIERIIEMVDSLDEVQDVSVVVRLLAS